MNAAPEIEAVDVVDCGGPETPTGDDHHFVLLVAGPLTGGYGPIDEVTAAVVKASSVAAAVVGQDPTDHEALWRRLAAVVPPDGRVAANVVGAIDCAGWDLHGRIEKVPVADLLAARPTETVPAYLSHLAWDLADPGSVETVAALAGGYALTKWSLPAPGGIGAAAAGRRLAGLAHLAAAASGTATAFDALGGWTSGLTASFARHAEPSDVAWLQDPLPVGSASYYRALAPAVPVGLGAFLHSAAEVFHTFRTVIPATLTFDVVGAAGLTEALRITDLADLAGVPVYLNGPGLLPAVHLAAARPRHVTAVEYQYEAEQRRQVYFDRPIVPDRGRLLVPTRAGFGVTIRGGTRS